MQERGSIKPHGARLLVEPDPLGTMPHLVALESAGRLKTELPVRRPMYRRKVDVQVVRKMQLVVRRADDSDSLHFDFVVIMDELLII